MIRSFRALIPVLAAVCLLGAGPQGGPGYMDPQTAVFNTLSTACSSGSGCAATSVASFTLASGNALCSVSVTGTFSATIAFDYSLDGINWSSAYVTPNTGSAATSTTSAFFGSITMNGVTFFRARASSYASGSPYIGIYCVPNP